MSDSERRMLAIVAGVATIVFPTGTFLFFTYESAWSFTSGSVLPVIRENALDFLGRLALLLLASRLAGMT